LALLAAVAGGLLALVQFGHQASGVAGGAAVARATGSSSRKAWWPRLTITVLAGLALACAIVAIRSSSAAAFWSGATYLLTWGLLGLSALGAIVDRGFRRVAWLGATLLGGGYMYLAFAREPDRPIPTDQLLDAVRRWSPRLDRSSGPANARILEALEQPIPMRFLNETPLGDVLAYIKRATSTPTYPGIPICVEPSDLHMEDRSFNGPVQMDLEGVPLKSTLRLCLKELGCTYKVQDGYVRIAPEEDIPKGQQEPFQVVGHCLLALLAAGFGSLAGRLVSGTGIPLANQE
jgi:hypothetical protein